MDPFDLDIPPGIVKADSETAVRGRFIDCDKVRWHRKKAEKIGGWDKHISDQLTGMCRSLHAFFGLSGVEVIGFGTHCKLYFLGSGGSLTDITPDRSSQALTNPISTTSGSAIVDVADTAHGASQGDTVYLPAASAVSDVTLAGDYIITAVVDDDNYQVTHSHVAAATAGPGGGSFSAIYEINCGIPDAGISLGYGMGAYGEGSYGDQRASGISLDPRFWSLDNYGSNLLAAPNGGTLYDFTEGTDTVAQIVANSPADIRFMFVSEERFPIVLRDSMIVSWPDQNDITDWTPSATNTAINRTLQEGAKLIGGSVLGAGVFLVWTDTGLYLFQYTGSRFVYESRLVGEKCGLVGPGAFMTVGGQSFWMSAGNFWMYDGVTREIPNQDDILDFVMTGASGTDKTQIIKVTCAFIAHHREIWWLYTIDGELEPSRYVAVNIDEYYWFTGTLDRGAAGNLASGHAHPLMVDGDGYVYEHELHSSSNAEALGMTWNLKSGLIRLGKGKQSLDIWGFIPDFETQVGDITLTVRAKDRPQSTSEETDTATISEGDEIEDLHVGGRHFGFELSGSAVDSDFRLGVPQVEIGSGGSRR